MSVLAFGSIVRHRSTIDTQGLRTADSASGQSENKLITALAAIIPVETLAAHALVLAATTSTDKDGVVTITNASWLQGSLLVLVAATVVAYLFARGLSEWQTVDWIRLGIPPVAFVAWTALIGTSALTPWLPAGAHAAAVVLASAGGILLVALAKKVAPPAE